MHLCLYRMLALQIRVWRRAKCPQCRRVVNLRRRSRSPRTSLSRPRVRLRPNRRSITRRIIRPRSPTMGSLQTCRIPRKPSLTARLHVSIFSCMYISCILALECFSRMVIEGDFQERGGFEIQSMEWNLSCNTSFAKWEINWAFYVSAGLSSECVVCPNLTTHHQGREIINTVFALPVDTVFTLLFTNSKFMLDLYTARKTTGKSAFLFLTVLCLVVCQSMCFYYSAQRYFKFRC